MTSGLLSKAPEEPALPDAWLARIRGVMRDGEAVRAVFETDLDGRLRFARGLVLLTDERLLSAQASDGDWQEWPLRADLSVHLNDHAGVVRLELVDGAARLASWRFTLAHQAAATVLCDEFVRQRDALAEGVRLRPREVPCCPLCNAPLPAGQESCTACGDDSPEAPSTWTLFRLWRFAKPYQGQLLLGFLLT
ncbi:MAG TPA: ABC transporter, partial [Quisquiliibacterium sp.]|nr:ABC transporter [Quisquiliibacterium sp.]